MMIRLSKCSIKSLHMRLFFLTPSLIGSIDDKIFILTILTAGSSHGVAVLCTQDDTCEWYLLRWLHHRSIIIMIKYLEKLQTNKKTNKHTNQQTNKQPPLCRYRYSTKLNLILRNRVTVCTITMELLCIVYLCKYFPRSRAFSLMWADYRVYKHISRRSRAVVACVLLAYTGAHQVENIYTDEL